MPATSKIEIPSKLYDRYAEMEALRSAFDRVANGGVELFMVSGQPGIGKTALINEFRARFAGKNPFFISGKYNEYSKNMPYDGIVQAINELVGHILTGGFELVWKRNILGALGRNGQVIVDVIPGVEHIIGCQEKAQELGPAETRNRFNLVFQDFISIFASKEKPLVIFLDDMQWVDVASLHLLQMILSNSSLKHFLLIGAFRDTQVDASHYLPFFLKNIKELSIPVNEINVLSLPEEEASLILVETLRSDSNATCDLSRLIYERTEGNPLFIKHYIKGLEDVKMLRLDPESGKWKWNIFEISQIVMPDNILRLFENKLQRLCADDLELLKFSACFGNNFDSAVFLSNIYGQPLEKVTASLSRLIDEGLVCRSDGSFRFSHDKIREAALSLIPEEYKKGIHLRIFNALSENFPLEKQEELLFQVLHHANHASGLITCAEDRTRLAELNLKGAKKAKLTGAYNLGLENSRAGISLLPENHWETMPELSCRLFQERSELELVCGNFDDSEKFFKILMEKVSERESRLSIIEQRILLLSNGLRNSELHDLASKALKEFGFILPAEVKKLALKVELFKVRFRIKKFGNLLKESKNRDLNFYWFKKIFFASASGIYNHSQELFFLMALRMLNHSIQHGYAKDNMKEMIVYLLLLPGLGKYHEGFQLIDTMLDRIDANKDESTYLLAKFFYCSMINPWRESIAVNLSMLKEIHLPLARAGNFTYSVFSKCHIFVQMFMKGEEIDKLQETAQTFLKDSLAKQSDSYLNFFTRIYSQAAKNLKGLTFATSSLGCDDFNEEEFLEEIKKKNFAIAAYYYHASKAKLLYIHGHFHESFYMGEEAEKYISGGFGQIGQTETPFYLTLSKFSLFSGLGFFEKKKALSRARKDISKMKKWADLCPENFLHKYLLMAAEFARVSGKGREDVLALYDQAIEAARKNGFIHHEAIALELAGKFSLEHGSTENGERCIKESHSAFLKWGATAKVKMQEEKYSFLRKAI